MQWDINAAGAELGLLFFDIVTPKILTDSKQVYMINHSHLEVLKAACLWRCSAQLRKGQ